MPALAFQRGGVASCRPAHYQTHRSNACSKPNLRMRPCFSVSVARTQHHSRPSRASIAPTRASTDYAATASDEGVLRLPPRTELRASAITEVFGFSRNLNDKYFIGKVIGAGSFGIVRECQDKVSGRMLAVKTISKAPKRGKPTPRYLLKLRTEVEVMQQLGSSLNAVNLKDVFEDDDSVHLVMELCKGGALLERVESRVYSESYIAGLVRSVLRFISQCHAKGIIYRDVKPDNFLFLTKDEHSPLKATDFGLSIRHLPTDPPVASRSGTPAYMAPELINQSYNERADLWSVGMMAYQLLTGRFPFWDDVRDQSLQDVWRSILYDDIDWDAPELRTLSAGAVNFLQRLLNRDPDARPSAAEVLEDPWVKEGGGEAGAKSLEHTVVQRLQRFATYTHLKQVVLKMIMEEMQRDGRELPSVSVKLRDLFARLDADASGALSFEELAGGLRAAGYCVTESEVEQLMAKVDLNHDGTIEVDEFLTTLLDWNQIADEQDERWAAYVDRAFDRMDLDGDGFISLDELLQELPAAYLTSSTASGSYDGDHERINEAKRMLREADENADGRISRVEFHNLLRGTALADSLSLYDDRLLAEGTPSLQEAA